MTRVVHVLHSFETGGLERGIARVVRHGTPDFEHVVVCLTRSGATAELLPSGTRVVEMHKPPGNSPRFLWRLSRALKQLRPGVVHTRNWGGVDGIVAARLAGIRAVCHGEHGWEMGDAHGRSGRRRRIRRFVSRWVREFTCVSRDIERWLRDDVRVRGPVTQIYNGVDTELFRPGPEGAEVRRELGIAPDAFVAGIVGRLDPIKDHPTLLRAFAALPGAVLLVVGDGPERERIAPLAGEGVHLLGERGDVPRVLRALDVFVLCSKNEGISNTILEAMATGLPAVVTDVGGNPELVADGETGSLVPPGNADALAAALLAYRGSPELAAAHGAAGRKRVLERFSVPAMVAAYEAVWRRQATGHRPQAASPETPRPRGPEA